MSNYCRASRNVVNNKTVSPLVADKKNHLYLYIDINWTEGIKPFNYTKNNCQQNDDRALFKQKCLIFIMLLGITIII